MLRNNLEQTLEQKIVLAIVQDVTRQQLSRWEVITAKDLDSSSAWQLGQQLYEKEIALTQFLKILSGMNSYCPPPPPALLSTPRTPLRHHCREDRRRYRPQISAKHPLPNHLTRSHWFSPPRKQPLAPSPNVNKVKLLYVQINQIREIFSLRSRTTSSISLRQRRCQKCHQVPGAEIKSIWREGWTPAVRAGFVDGLLLAERPGVHPAAHDQHGELRNQGHWRAKWICFIGM